MQVVTHIEQREEEEGSTVLEVGGSTPPEVQVEEMQVEEVQVEEVQDITHIEHRGEEEGSREGEVVGSTSSSFGASLSSVFLPTPH